MNITPIAVIEYHKYGDDLALASAMAKLKEVTNRARIWLNSIDERKYKHKPITTHKVLRKR